MAFGPEQLKNATPKWAKMVSTITFILTTAICGWVAQTNLLHDGAKYEITLALKLVVDPVVIGICKMFGVEPENV